MLLLVQASAMAGEKWWLLPNTASAVFDLKCCMESWGGGLISHPCKVAGKTLVLSMFSFIVNVRHGLKPGKTLQPRLHSVGHDSQGITTTIYIYIYIYILKTKISGWLLRLYDLSWQTLLDLVNNGSCEGFVAKTRSWPSRCLLQQI